MKTITMKAARNQHRRAKSGKSFRAWVRTCRAELQGQLKSDKLVRIFSGAK